MTTKGRPVKTFAQHLVAVSASHITQQDYVQSPATAFLKYVIDAKDAINQCKKYFKKNKDNSYNKDSLTSLRHITAAQLPAIMGHFETYQRYLFAGVFENSVHLINFGAENFFKAIQKESSISVDLVRLSAYRGLSAPVGIVLADSLTGWHRPDIVNRHFKALFPRIQLFSNTDCEELKVLWQLRHSIVHTGGSITLPDSQKVRDLSEHGDKPVVFDDSFILEVSRKLHPLIKEATKRIETEFRTNLKPNISQPDKDRIDDLFTVRSKVAVWLR